jgi:hypothetical protein
MICKKEILIFQNGLGWIDMALKYTVMGRLWPSG